MRLRGTPWTTNGEVPGAFLRKELAVPEGLDLLDQALIRREVSPRGVDKVIRLAWTLADLDGSGHVGRGHVAAALVLRRGDATGAAA